MKFSVESDKYNDVYLYLKHGIIPERYFGNKFRDLKHGKADSKEFINLVMIKSKDY